MIRVYISQETCQHLEILKSVPSLFHCVLIQPVNFTDYLASVASGGL